MLSAVTLSCISVHRLRLLLTAGSYWTAVLQYYLALHMEKKHDHHHHHTATTTITIPTSTQPNNESTATATNSQQLCVKIVAILLFVYDGSAEDSLVSAAEAVHLFIDSSDNTS